MAGKFSFFTFRALIACICAFTPYPVPGNVTGNHRNAALPYVNALLNKAMDSDFVRDANTLDTNGFIYTAIHPGNYFRKASIAGYNTKPQKISGSLFNTMIIKTPLGT